MKMQCYTLKYEIIKISILSQKICRKKHEFFSNTRGFLRNLCSELEAEVPYFFKGSEPYNSLIGSLLFFKAVFFTKNNSINKTITATSYLLVLLIKKEVL